MWCEQCQSDVATEISVDGQQLLCTTCHQPVRKVVAPSLHPETRSAREFLERWAREQQNLRTGQDKSASVPASPPPLVREPNPEDESPVADSPVTDSPVVDIPVADAVAAASLEALKQPEAPGNETGDDGESTPAESHSARLPKKKFRIDPQHSAPAGPMPSHSHRPHRPRHLENVTDPADSSSGTPSAILEPAAPSAEKKAAPPEQIPPATTVAASRNPEPHYRQDQAQASLRGPHFDPSALAPQRTVFPGRSEAIWGQLLAYAGVGLLTVGTIFVLWGYFGEIEQYASTGWLIATAGQMLLLLGIVTLVGGGMQQTTHEVTQRIEHLGGRIIRIEESTEKILQTPYFRHPRRRRKNADGKQDAA